MRFIIVLLMVLVMTTTVSAWDVKDYKKLMLNKSETIESKNANKAFAYYIVGVSNGFLYTNLMLANKKLPKLYCRPDDLEFNTNYVIDIINKQINVFDEILPQGVPNQSIEFLLLMGLMDKFPCK